MFFDVLAIIVLLVTIFLWVFGWMLVRWGVDEAR
jgi:hypothetical protein